MSILNNQNSLKKLLQIFNKYVNDKLDHFKDKNVLSMKNY